ncbi:MAG: putative transglutaminase-like cysteine proteinase [Glaciecola sp.]
MIESSSNQHNNKRTKRFITGVLSSKTVHILLLSIAVLPALYAGNQSELDGAKIVAALAENYDERAVKRGKAWLQLMQPDPSLSEREILEKVNRFFNMVRFIDDIDLWGVDDYWATPVEFIGVNGGDCEDFSIAKYFTLRELGIADEKMRITMVKAITLNQYHMVVAYYKTPSSVPLILDNIEGVIQPANQRKDLIPIFSFNGTQLWLNKEGGRYIESGNSSRVEQWQDLRQRINDAKPNQP